MVSLTVVQTRNLIFWAITLGAIAVAAIVIVMVLLPRNPQWREVSFWQQQASPGDLSAGHAFLEQNCGACHTPLRGVEAPHCIVCHANNQALLKRQTTSFHAGIGACAECHREHDGAATVAAPMDHRKLAAIGQRRLSQGKEGSEGWLLYQQLVAWADRAGSAVASSAENPHLTPAEMALDCRTCHATKDPHRGMFGRDCAQCHATTQWTLPEFRHPSPRSLDCAQCHQAPPSHYMEHFRMISMRIAGKMSAQVNQCYLCHQTTAWNDIRSVGYFKHH